MPFTFAKINKLYEVIELFQALLLMALASSLMFWVGWNDLEIVKYLSLALAVLSLLAFVAGLLLKPRRSTSDPVRD